MSILFKAMEAGMPKSEYAYRMAKKRLEMVERIPGLYLTDPVAIAFKDAYRRVHILFDAYLENKLVLDTTYRKAIHAIERAREEVKRCKADPARMEAARRNEREWHEEDMRALREEEAA